MDRMSARQLRLIPHARPLLERFGKDFFSRIPRSAGVYTMRDESRQILYIGQSGNLRARLATYKNARPGDLPRRIIRLVHLTRSIEWEECDSPEEALAQESRLIRRHRPKFNRAQTWPGSWYYLGSIAEEKTGLSLRLIPHDENELDSRKGETIYGSFKGLMIGRFYFGSLMRLLWSTIHQPNTLFDIPLPFARRIYSWRLPLANGSLPGNEIASWIDMLRRFLCGEDSDLVEFVQEELSIDDREDVCPLQQLFQQDLEMIQDFFMRGPSQVRELRREQGLELDQSLPPEAWMDEEDIRWLAQFKKIEVNQQSQMEWSFTQD